MKKKSKFLHFEIFGDNLDINEIQLRNNLPGEIFLKGETIERPVGRPIVSKTNRWLYSSFDQNETSINAFLYSQLKLIYREYEKLKHFIVDNKATIELIIYESDKNIFSLKMGKNCIKILEKIGLSILITFIDF